MPFEKLEGGNSAENQEHGPDSDYHKPPKTEQAVGIPKEAKEMDFSSAESWEELFSRIDEGGYVRGSEQLFPAKELKRRIDGVRKGVYPIDAITHTGGLRDTAEKLLELDEKKETAER